MIFILNNNQIKKNFFEKKFEVFSDFRYKMPGIDVGFSLLEKLNKEKIELFKNSNSKFESVTYYNFEEKRIYDYCFESLNMKMHQLYVNYINDRIVLKVKLYWLFSNFFENIVTKNNYKYKNDFTVHDILNVFIHSLRKNLTNDITKFFLNRVLANMCVQYLDITGEQFYLLLRQFILDLWKAKILVYESSDDSIGFNPIYYEDLYTLIYFSFDIMLLGKNKLFVNFELVPESPIKNLEHLYSSYESSTEDKKTCINDLLVSFLVSCSVEVICSNNSINNIFIENLIYGNNKATNYSSLF